MDNNPREIRGPSGPFTGGAWLSSARVVRCWVKSCIAQPSSNVASGQVIAGDSLETAGVNSEEGGDGGKSSCPLCLGCKHATMAGTKRCDTVRAQDRIKPVSVRIGVCNSAP